MSIVVTQNPQSAMHRVIKKVKCSGLHGGHFVGDDLGQLLSSLPLIQKSALVDYGNVCRENYLADAILFSETSGTTSSPLQTPRGKQDLSWNVLNQTIAYKQFVQPAIDRVAILHPSVLSPFVEASAMALQMLGVGYVRVFPIPAVCNYERIYSVFERYQITAVMSTPTLVYKLLLELGKLGNGKFPSSLKKILATGERFLSSSAKNMERILGSESMALPFVYGSSETATIMVGRRDCTYRGIAEDFIFEIENSGSSTAINPSLTDSIRGKLIVTWLREGMLPILRYDTGDIFTISQDQNTSEYIFSFEGRNDDSVLDIDTQQRIERTLFNLSFPIYHFECKVDLSQSNLRIDVIADADCESDKKEEIESSINAVLDRAWSPIAEVNPPNHSFFSFSPSPKTQKFIRYER